ncbi:MAG: hypothetical protein QM687_02870 [Ferruginibacter sp.]
MIKNIFLLCCMAASLFSCKQPVTVAEATADTAMIWKEVKLFMEEYHSLAERSDFKGIAGLYDSTGNVFVNAEKNEYQSYDSIKAFYQTYKDSIRYFTWHEPFIIDVIKSDVATVAVTYSLLVSSVPDTMQFNYSAVLVKRGPAWKLKQENEMPQMATARKLLQLMEEAKKAK